MSVVRVELPSELGDVVEGEVAAGHAISASAYVAEAVRVYVEASKHISAEAEAGIADIKAGRFTEVNSKQELEAWSDTNLARLRERLADQA